MLNTRKLRNPALYVIHHGARYLFPLVVTPYLARKFGPPNFADFVIWNACVWTASLFMEYGFFLSAVNATALSKTKNQLQETLSRILSAKLALLPIALVVYAILIISTGIFTRHPAAALIGIIAVISYGISFAWYFQGQERAATAVLVEALPQFLQFCLIFLFVRTADDVWVAALLQSLAALGTVVIAAYLIVRDGLIWRVAFNAVHDAIRVATPIFVERLCLTVYQNASPIIIAALSAREQVAFYSVGDKFLQFLGGLSIPLTYAYMPVISKRLSSEKPDWGLSLRLVSMVTASTCGLALVSFIGARYVIFLLFRPEYAAAIPIARCFCVTACLVSYNTCIANFILVPIGRSRILIMTSITALILSLSSQVYFLPRFGAFGSAVSRTVAEVGVALILSVFASRVIAGHAQRSDHRI